MPRGTLLTVGITHEGSRFESDAKVAFAIKGVGMGLHFEHKSFHEKAGASQGVLFFTYKSLCL
jgi:hypothetical protein